MKRYTVAVIGLGPRGVIHLYGLLRNQEHFLIVGICDHHEEKIKSAGHRFRIAEKACYTDAEKMMQETHPDIMVFATMPHTRLPFVQLAVRYHVKGLMFEKPMAGTLEEAYIIKKLCEENSVKAVVCQQHKYLESFLKLKQHIISGELGEICEIQANCQPHAAQLGTHYIDYMLWANNEIQADCVMGHVHGSFYLQDSHSSPDYVMGRIIFQNGVRGILECGYLSKPHAKHEESFTSKEQSQDYWTDDRLTVYGTLGYAWAQCNGYYGCSVNKTQIMYPDGYTDSFEKAQYEAQVRYTADFARWMSEDHFKHPNRISLAYHGYEILEGIYESALKHTRTDFPVDVMNCTNTHSVLQSILTPVSYKKI